MFASLSVARSGQRDTLRNDSTLRIGHAAILHVCEPSSAAKSGQRGRRLSVDLLVGHAVKSHMHTLSKNRDTLR